MDPLRSVCAALCFQQPTDRLQLPVCFPAGSGHGAVDLLQFVVDPVQIDQADVTGAVFFLSLPL